MTGANQYVRSPHVLQRRTLDTFVLLAVEGDEPVIVGGEAIVFLSATGGTGEGRVRVPRIVDHMTFSADGSIASLRAFWTMESIVPDPA